MSPRQHIRVPAETLKPGDQIDGLYGLNEKIVRIEQDHTRFWVTLESGAMLTLWVGYQIAIWRDPPEEKKE